VLVPALTFVATATAVIRAGAIPVFADVDADSWSLTTDIAWRAAREYPLKAIIPVSTYGCPLDADVWDAFDLSSTQFLVAVTKLRVPSYACMCECLRILILGIACLPVSYSGIACSNKCVACCMMN
jgi:hypothetical protein